MSTMTALIRTTDAAWAREHATPGPDADSATITFPAEAASETTFAGRRFYRIDLQAVAGALPADCLNRHVMIPDMHILTGGSQARGGAR